MNDLTGKRIDIELQPSDARRLLAILDAAETKMMESVRYTGRQDLIDILYCVRDGIRVQLNTGD